MALFPATDPIRDADSHAAQATAFADMSKLVGLRLPILATPMDRAAARSVATRDPELAERLLARGHRVRVLDRLAGLERDPEAHPGGILDRAIGAERQQRGLELVGGEALPAVVERYSNLTYLVLGATHPHVVAHEGEAYRESLQERARQLGLDLRLGGLQRPRGVTDRGAMKTAPPPMRDAIACPIPASSRFVSL